MNTDTYNKKDMATEKSRDKTVVTRDKDSHDNIEPSLGEGEGTARRDTALTGEVGHSHHCNSVHRIGGSRMPVALPILQRGIYTPSFHRIIT